MDSLSGLVLDVYDDFSGGILREVYPDFGAIPGKVKEAQVLSGSEREALPDDVFALVAVNNGEKLRKFACVDLGNTLLSVEYFLKCAHKLPASAQKMVAENLKVACAWYDVPVPEELEKVAIGMGTAMAGLMAVPVAMGTHAAIKNNLAANKAMSPDGRIVTPQERRAFLGDKLGEVSGTELAPNQGPTVPPSKAKAVIPKTAALEPDVVPPIPGEQPKALPQARMFRTTIDISNQKPPTLVKEKKAERYALPSEGKYPLDSYAQVKTASRYFDEYYKHMTPAHRHEYAVHLVKRASDLTIPVSDLARKYGSEDLAPEGEIKAAFDLRRLEVNDPSMLELLGDVEKTTRSRMWKEAAEEVSPEDLALVLGEFDKVAGLDHLYDRRIPDPFYSVLGFEKEAEDEDWEEVIGNEMVTKAGLRRLARVGSETIRMTFGDDLQQEFLKDPVGVFKSLPLDQKKIMMRMSGNAQASVDPSYI